MMESSIHAIGFLLMLILHIGKLQAFTLFMHNTNNMPSSTRDQSYSRFSKFSTALSRSILSTGIAAIPYLSSIKSTSAKTYFDITVYGDKELKIATVNKLKQKLRNAILKDPSIACDFMKIAINDALGFDSSSLAGGQDGSIQYELSRPENAGFEKAIDAINVVKKELQRTNTLSFGDVVAYAGSEALEAVGCSRIIVQVGRFDANKENTKTKIVPWNDLSDPGAVKEAFLSSGLDAKDIALLFGALGEINRIVTETKKAKSNSSDDDEDDESSDEEPFVPVTFGARDAIYGEKVGKADFGSTYLTSILKSKPNDAISKVLLEDPQVKSYVQKYAGNNVAFVKDLSDSYLRLTSVGQEFTNRNS
jgi:hypothetical protein